MLRDTSDSATIIPGWSSVALRTNRIMTTSSRPPVVWSIAGSDPSGGAGIQADLKTFQGFGVFGCAALTSVIAQNTVGVRYVEPVSAHLLEAQLEALANDVPPRAIKIGLVPTREAAQVIAAFVCRMQVPVVYDPVTVAGSGHALAEPHAAPVTRDQLVPASTIITPNLAEAERLTGHAVRTCEDMLTVAQILRAQGAQNVLLKGGHLWSETAAFDLWWDGVQPVWLWSPRTTDVTFHGTGCTLSSALAAALAQDFMPQDAAIIAKAYINQGIRKAVPIGHGRTPLYHGSWPSSAEDLPLVVSDPIRFKCPSPFPDCGIEPLGFYLIVDRAKEVRRFAAAGVRTIQLRAKDLSGNRLSEEIAQAVRIGREFGLRLFINDAWQLALQHQAYGAHLGQEDLVTADVEALRKSGMRLGVSVHSFSELAAAAATAPSYVGIGTVFATSTKTMKLPPLGLDRLRRMVSLARAPAVAIGGITLERAKEVFETGINGIAVISDVRDAPNPEQRARDWLAAAERFRAD